MPTVSVGMAPRSPRDIAVFAEDDTLTAPELLPGFSLPVAEIFE